MLIKYEYATGETVWIEVSDEWQSAIIDLDGKEKNNDRTETRRHTTLSIQGEQGAWLSDEKPDVYLECAGYRFRQDDERFEIAYSSLTQKQKALYEEVYVLGFKLKEFADQAGITPAAATKLNKKVIEKFEKVFKKVNF